MLVGCFQFNPVFGEKEKNLLKVKEALQGLKDCLLVLPEFFATGYQFRNHEEVQMLSEEIPEGYTTKALEEIARAQGLYIIGGLPERFNNRYYNSAVFVGPEGFIGLYRKTHLFFEEKIFFTPGDTGFRVWNTEFGRVGIMICFDWFFPESARTLAIQGADIIAHPSNLVLPHCPQAMPIRCLENRVFAITANRTGVEQRKQGQKLRFIGKSQIVSPEGKVIVRASEDREELLTAEIDVSLAREKSINPYNNLLSDRRPSLYGPLCA